MSFFRIIAWCWVTIFIAQNSWSLNLTNGDEEYLSERVSGRWIVDFDFEDNYSSTNPRSEFKDSSITSRFYSNIELLKGLQLNSYVKVGPLNQSSEDARRNQLPSGGGDISFENHGAFIEELNLSYNYKNATLVAGKFNLDFGSAWRWDRDIWGHSLSRNYKQVEKIGLGGFYEVGDISKTGSYNLSFFAFTNDRKNLDNSIVTKRDSDSKTDGRVGDTRSLKSYTFNLDVAFDFGKRFNQKEQLTYRFSYLDLAINKKYLPDYWVGAKDQKAWSAGLNYVYPMLENYTIDALFEYARIKSLGGNCDISEQYYTASLVNRFFENYNLTLVTTLLRNKDRSMVNGFHESLSEISMGYDFRFNRIDKLNLQIGYKKQRVARKLSLEKDNAYGFLLRYYKYF